MSEQVDLDAIELRAMRFQKLNPLHECFDSTTVLALIGELRQERERNAILTGPDSDERDALITDPLVRRIQEERERADDLYAANVGLVDAVYATDAALSRAEETIDRAIECEERTHRLLTLRNPTREDSSLTWRILTEYGKQREPKTKNT